ncbi:HTH_XRE domain containing protein [uncultured Caudovirales phage]|uniref:HTH_XRE domain containing protein n=1 Tax=uncultured Caudovirales phage TaxID=2100421 RepID=A0A6J7WPI9_9CAUD|nr:HTH_XRE domain containing protein [uncultured Caudovirales phage]
MTQKQLEAVIKASGETKTALALRIGVTPRTLRRWLSGQYPIPHWVEAILK